VRQIGKREGAMKWRIPARIVEHRGICVEAETKAEALMRFRKRDWIESDDADDTRYEIYKAGKIEKIDDR
jgi:hypothetical protein